MIAFYCGLRLATETVYAAQTWAKTIYGNAELNNAIKKKKSDGRSNNDNKEATPGKINLDTEHLNKNRERLQIHSLFTDVTVLACLDVGFPDKKQTVTCDNAESISAAIQRRLSEKLFTELSFKRKAQITYLKSLYFTAPYDKDDFYIDSLTPSLHFVLSIDRKPETEIDSYFQYKLTPYLASLFHDRAMRLAKEIIIKETIF